MGHGTQIVPGARSMTSSRPQAGVALLTALLIVALVAVSAVSIVRGQFLNLHRAENLLHGDQAYVYALGVESWALGMLTRDARQDEAAALPIDAATESWNAPLSQTEVEGGSVAGRIEDLQGRFNLNNLAGQGDGSNARQLAYLQRLLRQLQLDPALAAAIADWLDADVDTRYPDGAEDLAYMRGDRPYRTNNGYMGEPSELLLIAGITPAVYQRLAPYVVALPQPTTINVNTAPLPVLAALSDTLDPQSLEAALAVREQRGFASVDAFLEAVGMEAQPAAVPVGNRAVVDENWPGSGQPGHNPEGGNLPGTDISALIGTSSDFFLVRARARVDRSEVRLHSVIWRQGSRGPQIIARTRQPFDS